MKIYMGNLLISVAGKSYEGSHSCRVMLQHHLEVNSLYLKGFICIPALQWPAPSWAIAIKSLVRGPSSY